jgi:dolichol-phosphate mannosyltransferase
MAVASDRPRYRAARFDLRPAWSVQPLGRWTALGARFAKFGLVGASGVAVNTAVFWLLTAFAGIHHLLAAPVAFEVALGSNFLLNNAWTFADRRGRHRLGAVVARYHLASVVGLAINLAVLHQLTALGGLHPSVANLIGIALASVCNFAVNVCWTWRAQGSAVAPVPLA